MSLPVMPSFNQSTLKSIDRNIKLDDFTGLGISEDFLEWEREGKKISDYKGFDDANRFNIAYICLTKNAGAWFESLKARHARAGKSGSFTANTGYASRKEFLVKVGPTGELARNNVLIYLDRC